MGSSVYVWLEIPWPVSEGINFSCWQACILHRCPWVLQQYTPNPTTYNPTSGLCVARWTFLIVLLSKCSVKISEVASDLAVEGEIERKSSYRDQRRCPMLTHPLSSPFHVSLSQIQPELNMQCITVYWAASKLYMSNIISVCRYIVHLWMCL